VVLEEVGKGPLAIWGRAIHKTVIPTSLDASNLSSHPLSANRDIIIGWHLPGHKALSLELHQLGPVEATELLTVFFLVQVDQVFNRAGITLKLGLEEPSGARK